MPAAPAPMTMASKRDTSLTRGCSPCTQPHARRSFFRSLFRRPAPGRPKAAATFKSDEKRAAPPSRRPLLPRTRFSSASTEELLHPIEEPLRPRRVRLRILLVDRFELAQQLLLPRRKLDRRLERDVAVQVAGHRAAHGANALVAQAEHLPGLCLRGDLDLRLAVERGDLDLAAERRGREADRHLAMQVGAFALEHRVRLQLHDDVEIAVGAAVDARLAFARETDAVVLVDARGNLHRQRLLLPRASRALAAVAGVAHDLAGTVAARARLLDREEALRDANLAAAVAARASLRLRAGLRTGAMARRALLERGDADLCLGAARRLLEREVEVVAQVRAAKHPVAAAAASLAEDLAEDVAERVGESTEALGSRPAPAGAEAGRRVHAGVPELIVGRALLRIRKNLVGFLRFLEFLLGALVVRIAIRMVLHRELPVDLLQVLVGRIATQPQDRVVVALVGHEK